MKKYATKAQLDTMRPTVHDDEDCGNLGVAGEVVEVETADLEDDRKRTTRCRQCHSATAADGGRDVPEHDLAVPMTDSALDHALETAESALGSSDHLAGLIPGGGGRAEDARDALEDVVSALQAERRGRGNESLEDYE